MKQVKTKALLSSILSLIVLTSCHSPHTNEPTPPPHEPVTFSIESILKTHQRPPKNPAPSSPSPNNATPTPEPTPLIDEEPPTYQEPSEPTPIYRETEPSTPEQLPPETADIPPHQPTPLADPTPENLEPYQAQAAQQQEPPGAPNAPAPAQQPTQPQPQGVTLPYCGAGGQPLVDSCRGLVRFSIYETVGFSPTYAIHWEHGGYQLPLNGGNIHIENVGTFRLGPIVSTLNFHTHNTHHLPYGAAPVFFQTCLNGDNTQMVFIAAHPL